MFNKKKKDIPKKYIVIFIIALIIITIPCFIYKPIFKDYNVKNIASINNYNYRNKVTLHVVNSKIGFFNENTNNLVEIDNCLMLCCS